MTEEQGSFDEQVTRQIQRLWVTLVVLGVFTVAAMGLAGWALMQKASTAQLAQKASVSQLAKKFTLTQRTSCIVTNITRATDNRSHLSDWRFEEQQVRFTEESLRSNYVALQKIGIDKKILHRALLQSEASLQLQRQDAAAKTWTALSDCAAPADRMNEIQIWTISSKKPPASALSILNALKADPVGSVNVKPGVHYSP